MTFRKEIGFWSSYYNRGYDSFTARYLAYRKLLLRRTLLYSSRNNFRIIPSN